VEPERTGVLAEVVLSKAFQGIAGFIILLNCVYMVVTANAQVEDPGAEPTEMDKAANMFFLMFYTLEVILKLLVHRGFFFWNEDWRWNVLDFFLVAYGYSEMILGGLTITWLRSLRLFRMVRVLRVLKLAKSMKELRLILSCLLGSFVNLLWSIVMILIIVFMFSLVFVQETAAHLESTEAREEELMLRFGSVERCMLNLFEAAMGGQDWEVSYNTLEPTGPISCALYLFFIAFIQIALVNILTGIFVEKALMRAQPDREAQAVEQRQEVTKMRSELRELCRSIDMDGTGTISPREFDHPRSFRLKDYLHLMGLDMEDIQSLFDLLSGSSKDKSVGVEVEVFVSACLRMRNGTSAVDMQRLLCEVELNRRVLSSQLRNLAGSLEGTYQSRAIGLSGLSRAPSNCVGKPDRLAALEPDQHDPFAPDQHPNLNI
jgi:voltage-gated sodium channel